MAEPSLTAHGEKRATAGRAAGTRSSRERPRSLSRVRAQAARAALAFSQRGSELHFLSLPGHLTCF